MLISRSFVDSLSVRWHVAQWWVGRAAEPPVRSLVYTSRAGDVVVRDFPSDWMHLSDADLERVRASAR